MNTEAIDISTSSTNPRTQSVVQTLLFTAAGVGTLFLLGKLISAAGTAAGLPNACWQLTGARAAAAALVVGSMARFRVGHLALFGVAYGATMLSSHTNWTLVGSAALAGVVAWLIFTLFTARRAPSFVGVLLPTLAYTLIIMLSGLISAIQAMPATNKLESFGVNVGIRAAMTTITVAIVWFASNALARRSEA